MGGIRRTVVCAYCGHVIQNGLPPVSHGCCQTCFDAGVWDEGKAVTVSEQQTPSEQITRDEWERRFKLRLIERGGTTPEGAQAELDGGTYESLSEGFENDPEGSADEAMSYWEP